MWDTENNIRGFYETKKSFRRYVDIGVYRGFFEPYQEIKKRKFTQFPYLHNTDNPKFS